MLSDNNADFLSYTYSERAIEDLANSTMSLFSFKEAHQGAVADDYNEEKYARYLKHADLLSGSALKVTEDYLNGLANNWTEVENGEVKHYSFTSDDLLHYFHHLENNGEALKDLPFGLQKKIFEDAKAGVSGAIYYVFWRMYIIISNRLYKFLGGTSNQRAKGLAGLRDGKKDFISIAYITLTKTYKQGGDIDAEKDQSALHYYNLENPSLVNSKYPSKYFSMFATLYDNLLNNSNVIHAKDDNGGVSHFTKKDAKNSSDEYKAGSDSATLEPDIEDLGKITTDGGISNRIDNSLSVSDDEVFSSTKDMEFINEWKNLCKDDTLYDAKYPTPADILKYIVKYFFYDKRLFSDEDKKIITDNFEKEWEKRKDTEYLKIEAKITKDHREELLNKTIRPADIFKMAKEEIQKLHDNELNSLIEDAKKAADERSVTKNPSKTQSDLMHDLGQGGSVIGLAVLKTRFKTIDELFTKYGIEIKDFKAYIERHGNAEMLKYIK